MIPVAREGVIPYAVDERGRKPLKQYFTLNFCQNV